ncbi:hypothetical protein AP064_03925 [Candidatus Liberibacter solanacearum]|uniref:Uncharacterized protein n=1 Tax=Candidatus Liberibacter solanacearum TaxID=556287 RepID=A0A0F4VJP1_9HYPH|nr:hypothetical protein KP07_01545 [Candidatus Liberibacter solanacearum]KJZ81666.1 hypothetical protein DJ66_0388 [Candidatus Liberibacter solanacearum]KQC48936.1 hypothetical protein AP064_03925 [Candidatus Liberibacter solanacearum]
MSSPDNDLSARIPTTIKSIKDADLHDLVTAIGAEKTAYHREKLKNYKEKYSLFLIHALVEEINPAYPR